VNVKISIANAALLGATLAFGAAVAEAATKPATPAPAVKAAPAATAPANDDADRALMEKDCSSCHSVDQVTARNRSAAEWAETIDRMINYGAQLTPEDNKRIADFLAAHYGDKSGS
jgi:cytochrome c5